jgi:hypothetical protein
MNYRRQRFHKLGGKIVHTVGKRVSNSAMALSHIPQITVV